jgi:hypothetical protein
MRREKIKIKNKKVISGDNKVAANEGHQRRLSDVAADEGSITATLWSPLMRREKIKIKKNEKGH